ncbi:hypothetical protein GIB67_002604 [Kingdonia uniflora]|uniref:CHHC U11-48K-type domain-containing protein n=1 Tax=Kingdonia uniflora TaxID=39325 RepID=A0A7J7P8J1_9MAGN|nr:hypothetical protein GIB67_002604 [Kingdonia uniflora]
MNPPPNPFFNTSFTFLPQNQNPNPNSTFSHLPNPQFHPPRPKSDLLTTISLLKQLINQSKTTLEASTNLIFSSNESKTLNFNPDLCPCPFDCRHRIPPEHLFNHYLGCSSSPRVIDLDVLGALKYLKSFKPEEQLMKENPFVQTLEGYDSELCFSLDGYVGDFGSNFAYKDCPGIVCCNSIEQDISSKNTFTLPSVLSAQCANFVISRRVLERETPTTKILPSELVFLQSEVGLWNNDYPCSYSSSVVRVVLSLRVDELGDCVKWVLRNSPRYGIVIDAPMRDHIFLLFKLCLKAISLEAYHLSTSQNPASQVFECPVLVEVMSWLACQLSGLYGELQGKLFCVNMLKHCVLSVSKVKVEELDGKCERGNFICGGDGNSSGSLVFVSQVAAAVAALHERSVLEEKIKGLRLSGSLSKSQLITEHSYLTTKANDERRKRSNYRPILEHDGLLWQRPRNQDSNENKTEEELLAEERDYKRRRTSYRGKKVKRSTTEVMRDIIEEHMEEIKQAGGIGCFVKGSFESGTVLHGSVSVNTDVQIERASRDYRKEPP